jgi:putative ABC transport system ATP-binding protein
LIEVERLRKEYRGNGARAARRVLDEVSLQVEAGSFCALLGASGAGKTTLLNVLGGLDSAFEGEVRVAGTSLRGRGDAELAAYRRDTVGFMFQEFHLLEHLSAVDNVLLSARFEGRARRAELRVRALELLTRVGLEGRHAERPGSLSGGERQRVALARALLRTPRVILADEPTGNLDAETGARLIALLQETARERQTALVVATHDERVAAGADRSYRLEAGRLEERA